jgi:hypothetical protein
MCFTVTLLSHSKHYTLFVMCCSSHYASNKSLPYQVAEALVCSVYASSAQEVGMTSSSMERAIQLPLKQTHDGSNTTRCRLAHYSLGT